MPSYITMLGVVPTKPKLAWNPIYFVSRQAPWDLGRGCRLLWNTSKNQADPTTISKATSLARFCSDEGVGSAVDCAPRRKKVSICSGVRIPVEQWSSPPVYELASRSVVLESSYSMVQLFSPTSGSQEWIAVVGSAQHKSLLYSLPSGARQTELRAAQRTTSRTTIRSSKALQPKGLARTPWWKSRAFTLWNWNPWIAWWHSISFRSSLSCLLVFMFL